MSLSIGFDPKIRSFYSKNIPCIVIGNCSYMVGVDFIGRDFGDCALIGKFSSISTGEKFLLSQNHDYRLVSSYPFGLTMFRSYLPKSIPPPSNTVARWKKLHRQSQTIGRDVTIIGGVHIGTGSVIGANSTVAKDLPPYSIAVGNPARVIKYRFDKETIRKMLAIKWWNWSLDKIQDTFPIFDDPKKFTDEFYSPELEQYQPDKLSNALRDFKYKGFKIYSTIIDLGAVDPTWKKILADFARSNLHNAILVFHASKNISYNEILKNVSAVWKPCNDKFIFAIRSNDENSFSIDSLRETDIFITTREFDCLTAIDYLYDKDIKIRYAYDDLVFY